MTDIITRVENSTTDAKLDGHIPIIYRPYADERTQKSHRAEPLIEKSIREIKLKCMDSHSAMYFRKRRGNIGY